MIVGTLGKSALIDSLVATGKLDASDLPGKWESFVITTVANPVPGVERALVIAGSDKRGTIYGIYELSEQIGVSPWYWWADVPAEDAHASLRSSTAGYASGEPGGQIPRHLPQRRGALPRPAGPRRSSAG